MPRQLSINLSTSVHVHAERVREKRPGRALCSKDHTVNLAEANTASVLCLRRVATNWVMNL